MYQPTDEDQRFFGDETGQEREVAQELQHQQQERASQDLQGGASAETPVYDDPTGSVFAGPANEAVPSSMSAYHSARRRSTKVHRRSRTASHATRRSTSSKRPTIRRAGTSRSSLPSAVSSESSDDDGGDLASQHNKKSRRSSSFRRKSRDTDAASTTSSRRTSKSHVSAAASLRGRRPSVASTAAGPSDDETDLGRPSGDYSDDENPSDDVYGPYGSSVSSEDSADSSRSAEGSSGLFLTHGFVGGPDPLFGEHRVDMEEDGDSVHSRESDKRIFDSLGGNITGSKQPVYFPDEDLHVVFVGWGPKTWKVIVWTIASVLTLGILPLLGRWLPHWWIRGKGKDRAFARASAVVAHTSHGDQHVLSIQDITFDPPVSQASVFPPSLVPPPSSREEANNPPAQPRIEASMPTNSKGRMISSLRVIDYRYYRLLLHPDTNLWRMVRDWRDPLWAVSGVRGLRRGPEAQARHQRQQLFGSNIISIEAKSILELLLDECLHPFYCFQVASIILWSLDDYVLYAATIFIISIISIISTLIETRANTKRMVEMSRFECPVQVQQGGRWSTTSSEDLVPGDLVDLTDEDLTTFPADLVLLSGEVIVNESMLTGESVPVSKTPIEEAEVPKLGVGGDLAPSLTKHVVFCGTKIVRVRPTAVGKGETEAVGMVLRTGFNTTKGALVRSMLFPRPLGFKFYRDSFRFIGILSGIAGLGFLGSVTNFVKLGISWTTILKRALDLITITCPPALPATMSIGTSFAINRLRKAAIYCISPNRVNVGGKTNLWVFDKTGTLTEEGLDVLGVRSVDRTDRQFSDLHTDAEDIPIIGAQDAKTPLLHALAACHALKLVDGELIGDPLDLRMFEFTKWTLEEGREDSSRPSQDARRSTDADERVPDRPATLVQSVVRPPGGQGFRVEDALRAGQKHAHFLELGIIRTFDFVSSLRRMSVMVKKLKSKSIEVYCKGAPEAISTICDKDTLPEDFDELLAQYTRHGFRIIALAAKSIPNLTWLKAQRMKRDQAESGLRFLGLIIFENKLKPGTTPVINTLKHARIGARMCTGDNIRTAVSVGRECGIVPENARVYIPTFISGDETQPNSELIWTDVEDDDYHLDAYGLTPLLPDDDSDASSVASEDGDWALAVSGNAFRWIVDYAPLETLQRMLVKTAIFARMSPDEKHELVDRLQALGYTVGFCGDGANDCGALKAADVGLSLSEAEASVAAPFTSRSPDISCVIEVIREGRAALVTSFSCFKYMALYSLIQFTTVTLLYSIASSLGDFQFLYIDLFIILPIAVTMGRTAAYPRIHPKAPTANLVSKQVLTSLGGQILLTSGFQLFVFFYVRAQDWYKPPAIHVDKLKIKNFENTALFLISSFQYILVAAVFCVGPPYRQSIPSNTWLLLTLIGLVAFSAYTLFATSGPIYKLLQLVHIPREFHLELALLVIINCILSYMWEKHWAVPIAKWMGKSLKRWRRKHGKVYKSVARDIR